MRDVASSPFRIAPTADQRAELERRACSYTGPFCEVQRAKLVLMVAEGATNAEIAVRLGTSPQVVHRWRKRFCERGVRGLADKERSGRPRLYGAEVTTEVKALACQLPATTGAPLSRWSSAELAWSCPTGHRGVHLGGDGVADAPERRHPAVAAPLVDIPP